MTDIKRRSPVKFEASALGTEVRGNWTIALEYDGEGSGPYLVDLCHKTRWDLQSGDISAFSPCDVAVPDSPGACTFENGVLINRMNRTQAAIWHLTKEGEALPDDQGYTDVSESTVFLAMFGDNVFAIAEKLTALDFMDPEKSSPFLMQGPFSHVPCQIVTIEKGDGFSGGILLTCSRGYARSMIHAILDAGAEFGLRPAGEKRFTDWIATLAG